MMPVANFSLIEGTEDRRPMTEEAGHVAFYQESINFIALLVLLQIYIIEFSKNSAKPKVKAVYTSFYF
jgi:hypothetical protein